MADDAKCDDGDRGRLRRALNQLRKDRREERAARELQEEMQQYVDEAQERAWESEQNLCSKLVEYMYSWERAIGRPNNLGTNNTKSENLESDFTEILEKTHLLGWNETAKSIRVWAEKEEAESSWSWSGSCWGRLFLNWEISWSGEVVLKSSLLKENGGRSVLTVRVDPRARPAAAGP